MPPAVTPKLSRDDVHLLLAIIWSPSGQSRIRTPDVPWDRVARLACARGTGNAAKLRYQLLKRKLSEDQAYMPSRAQGQVLLSVAAVIELRIRWEKVAEEMNCTQRQAREKYAALQIKTDFTKHEGEGEEIREGIFVRDRVIAQSMLVHRRRIEYLEERLAREKAKIAETERDLIMWRQIERENITSFGWVRE